MILKKTGFALLCTFMSAIMISGILIAPAHAISQKMPEEIPLLDLKAAPCSDAPDFSAQVNVEVSQTDRDNLNLAKHMEEVMSHYGYDKDVTRALFRAHLKTGVDFKLLVLKAIMESDYGRFNVAANSSARGVFQYIEPTWLVLMHRYGEKAGYGHYAELITYNKKIKMASLEGPARHMRGEILALRHNPDASALIKAYQVLEETDVIRSYKQGKSVTATDHYIAHMLGLYVMKDFYKLKNRGSVIAPARLSTNVHMREAAHTNRSFFFKGNTPLTAAQSYARFENKVERQFRKITSMKKAKIVEVSNSQSCSNETGAPFKTPETLKTILR